MGTLNLDGNFELCEFRGQILHYLFEYKGGDPKDFTTKRGRFLIDDTPDGGMQIKFFDCDRIFLMTLSKRAAKFWRIFIDRYQ